MAEVFSFRPAPLRRAQDWRLDGDRLEGAGDALDLRTVTALRLVDMSVGRNRMRRLDLVAGRRRLRLSVNVAAAGSADNPDRAAHAALMRAVGARLAARDPVLPVVLGEGGWPRHVLFGIGVLALLFAAGLPVSLLLDAVPPGRAGEAAMAAVPLGLVGGVLVLGNAPWRSAVTIPVAALAETVEALEGPGGQSRP